MPSKIVPLLRKAFGTSNVNEASSFLTSAICRLRGEEKTTVEREVKEALSGVRLGGGGDAAPDTRDDRIAALERQLAAALAAKPAKGKTVYKDTKATIALVASLRAQLAAYACFGAPDAIDAKFKSFAADLDHLNKLRHEELALVRSHMQRRIDELEKQKGSAGVGKAVSERITQLEGELRLVKSERLLFWTYKEKAEEKVKVLEAEIATLNAVIAASDDAEDMAELRIAFKKMSDNFDIFKQVSDEMLADADHELAQVQKRLDYANDVFAESRKLLEAYRAIGTPERIKARLSQADSIAHDRRIKINHLEEELRKVNQVLQNIYNAPDETDELRRDVTRLKAAFTNEANRYASVERRYNAMKANRDELQTELDQQMKNKGWVISKWNECDEENKALTQINADLQADNELLRNQVRELLKNQQQPGFLNSLSRWIDETL